MYFKSGAEWTFEKLQFIGRSVAGVGTCIYVPNWKLCFDVAQGLPYALGADTYLITHGHADHAGGIPFLLSQKRLNHLKNPIFYMPEVMIEPLKKIMTLWGDIEGFDYGELDFRVSEVGRDYSLRPDLFFRPFETVHRVPSNGYTIFESRKKLRKDLTGLSQKEIQKRRLAGETVDERWDEPVLSFTGDTKIEFLDQSEAVKNSRVLFMEVTYGDERKPVESARKWGHIHLDEVIPRLQELNCEKIVFMHLSRRYKDSEMLQLIRDKIKDEELKSRIVLFPRHPLSH